MGTPKFQILALIKNLLKDSIKAQPNRSENWI